MNELSGGWRRRVALAQAWYRTPSCSCWTNRRITSTSARSSGWKTPFATIGAVLFVTHDRSFVEKVATRIVDIDRGKLRSWPGGYLDYLDKKSQSNEDEDRQNALFDKKLAEEEAWIRPGRQSSPDAQTKDACARSKNCVRSAREENQAAARGTYSAERVTGAVGAQGHRGAKRHARLRGPATTERLFVARHARDRLASSGTTA